MDSSATAVVVPVVGSVGSTSVTVATAAGNCDESRVVAENDGSARVMG